MVGTNVVLTMASAVAAGATVAYTPPVSGTAAIQDAAGNKALSVSTTTPATADTAAPVLDSSLVFYNGNNGVNKFVLYFNEEMASSTTIPGTGGPANTGFNISIVDPLIPDRTGGASIAWAQSGGSSSFTEKAFAISFVLGYLSTSASVQMKYVDPGNAYPNALKDLAGNHAGNMVLGAWTNDNLSAVDGSFFVAGKSVLVAGGQGNDTMTGGAANDTFAWFAGDAGTSTGAVDIVKSFTAWIGTAGDKLDISKLLTNGYVSGTSTLSQWVTSVTNNASGAPSGVGTTNTKIVIDVDGTGSGTVTQTIWLDGVNLSSIDPAVLKSNGILIA